MGGSPDSTAEHVVDIVVARHRGRIDVDIAALVGGSVRVIVRLVVAFSQVRTGKVRTVLHSDGDIPAVFVAGVVTGCAFIDNNRCG